MYPTTLRLTLFSIRHTGGRSLQKIICRTLSTVFLIAFLSTTSLAQLLNDECSKAIAIPITNNGFDLGTFKSGESDLTHATIQTGEFSAPSFVTGGINKKTVWYKFSLPTTRAVRVSLSQPGKLIQAGNVGFAVFKTNECLPGKDDLYTKFTPIETFGWTQHPCVGKGDYLIQVSSNNNADGPIFITLDIADTTGAVYDKPKTAQKIGKVSNNRVTVSDFIVECQSIDNAAEICLPNTSFKDFTKSSWHTFTTPDYFDYFSVWAGPQQTVYNPPRNVIGYRLYEGDVTTLGTGGLTQVGGCDSLVSGYYGFGRKVYGCGDLKFNKTYTIQLIYHKDYTENLRLVLAWDGTEPTKGHNPVTPFPTPNKIGVLTASISGESHSYTDQLACNSRHSEHDCAAIMPENGISTNSQKYNLSTFFSFTIKSTSTLQIWAYQNYCGPQLYLQIYKQSLTGDCADLKPANLIASYLYNGALPCLDPGDYVIQISGADTLRPLNDFSSGSFSTNNYPLCLKSSLGGTVYLGITAKTVNASNKFSLSANGKVDQMNESGGTMKALKNRVTYDAEVDTFGCANTVLPAGTICNYGNDTTKVVYRTFVIADSMALNFTSGSIPYSMLYKGDANALAAAQNKHSFPQRITGLQKWSNCIWYSSANQQACVTPGTYTYAQFGGPDFIGQAVSASLTPSSYKTKHFTPATAQNLGSLWDSSGKYGSLSFTSDVDTFSCYDNDHLMKDLNKCGSEFTKFIFRQFYISKPSLISISIGVGYYQNYNGSLTLFKGKATDGIEQLSPAPGWSSCFSSGAITDQCNPFEPGWYTLVTSGYGGSYEDAVMKNGSQTSMIGLPTQFTITLSEACPLPKFNRPFKASIDTNTKKPYLIQWAAQTGSTAAYPVTFQNYTLQTENFNCIPDTPFSKHPIEACAADMKHVAYYVFTTTQESYLQIDTRGYWGKLFGFDVRKDSSKMITEKPIQECLRKQGLIQICKLQPGTYTLVIFSESRAYCHNVTPTIYIDKIGYSRFDHANNAYDFGIVKADSIWHNGKKGDVNPLNSGRAPSNDFFYCSTGSREKDPDQAVCYSLYNDKIYLDKNNNSLHTDNSKAPEGNNIDRRNLWYTFVIDKPGTVRVRVQNMTAGKTYQYPYSIYKSDADAKIPFDQLRAGSEVDSTQLQGLTFIRHNLYYHYCDSYQDVDFYVEPCAFTPTRYYILVENRNPYPYADAHLMSPNHQVEVSVLVDSATTVPTKFDHYFQASNIGEINSGTKKGALDNFTCATGDLTDPISSYNCQKTLWYKFTTTTIGNIRYRAVIQDQQNYGDYYLQLFKESIPGDSTSKGLKFRTATSYPYDNGYWSQQCVEPGTYYILITGCSAVDQNVYPEIQILEQAGDFCSKPMVTSLSGKSSKTIGLTVDCHTIGTDYGEFNSTITCPPGSEKIKFKSSWYRIDVGGTDTLDVTVFINEQTNAGSSGIKYRMMTGNCGAMQEQSCVQDALTKNTYKCLAPGTSYYIQVFTPVVNISNQYVTGNIDLNISSVKHADTCLPGNVCIAVANFEAQFDCTKNNAVKFSNNSTYGSAITYDWDFGYNKKKSSDVSPEFTYPALTTNKTYTVKLVLTNISCGKKDSITQTVLIPARPLADIGNDTSFCTYGSSIQLDASSFDGATYYWSNGQTTPKSTFTYSGSHWVEIKYKNCISRDTIDVYITPIQKRSLETKALCNVDEVTLNANRGYGEKFKWNTGETNYYITTSQPGYYWVDIFLNGCNFRDSFLVVSTDLRPLGNDTSVCQAKLPLRLNSTVSGASSYQWQDGSADSKLSVTKEGKYWVNINLSGCTFSDTILVNVDSFKTVNTKATICSGQQYSLPSGRKIAVSGVYKDTLVNSNGCDSLITNLNLTVQEKKETTIVRALCDGDQVVLPSGLTVKTAGIWNDTLRNVSGCDSVITHLTATLAQLKRDTIETLICAGSSYLLPSGKSINKSGVYSDTLKYKGGCDSLIRSVTLNVYLAAKSTVAASFCSGKSYTLPSGKPVILAGKYTDTIHSILNGCDSLIITTNLSFIPAKTQKFTAFICSGDNYKLPSGTNVNLKGIYIDTLRNALGCDSIISTITLNLDTVSRESKTVSLCEGQKFTMPSGIILDKQGIYTDTVKNIRGCDRLITTVKFNLALLKRDTITTTICSGASYLLPSGKIQKNSGVYADTLKYSSGCDSVIYSVNLNVYHAIKSTLNASFCSGKSYTLPSGKQVSVAAKYVDTLHSQLNGCDSAIITTNLSLIPAIKKSFAATICAGDTYMLPSGKAVTNAGIYIDTLKSVAGCDSLVNTINLSIDEKTFASKDVSICAGSGYTTPSGNMLNKAGTYKDTLKNIRGCDSLITTIRLSVIAVTQKQIAVSICAGNNYLLPSGKTVSRQSIYSDTLRYAAGCDSVIYSIDLTVSEASKESVQVSICTGNSYKMPSGKMISTQGQHLDTLKNKMGCDSILYTINLHLIPVLTKNTNAVICAGGSYLMPSGKLIKQAGIYADTLHGSLGCDSLISNITLTIDEPIRKSITESVCPGTAFRMPSGFTVILPGIYQDTMRNSRGCDSLITTLKLSNKQATASAKAVLLCNGEPFTLPDGNIVTTAGVFTSVLLNSSGCDSTITTTITRRPALAVRINGTADICAGASLTLKAIASGGTGSGYQYSWSVAGVTGNEITIQPTSVTRIVVTVTDGCTSGTAKDTIEVTPIPKPEPAFAVPSDKGCAPFKLLFSNNSRSVSGSKAHWDFGTGNPADTSNIYNPQFSFTKPGEYHVKLTISTPSGCVATTESKITVIAKPTVHITGPASICAGGSVQFNASASGEVKNWKWDFGNGNSSVSQQPDLQTYTTAGTYKVMLTATADQACPDTAYFTLTVNPAPTISLNHREPKICLGQSVQLEAAGGTRYAWSPSTGLSATNIANPIASPAQDIVYKVNVTSSAGCVSVDSVKVSVTQPFVLSVSDDEKICAGEEVKLLATGAVRYSWMPATSLNNATIANPVAKPYITTTYTVTGFGKDECFITTKEVTITVVPLPTVALGRDTSVYGGTSFPIHVNASSDVVKYSWTPSDYLSCTYCASPVASPRETMTYQVTVANAEGCKASDEVRITLACSDAQVFIPNTFTPNNDGANDVFYPRGKGIKSVKTLRIFNRWGELVFEKKDFNIDDKRSGWDGVYKGERLSSGVFVYTIQLVCDNGQMIDKSGSIMIVR